MDELFTAEFWAMEVAQVEYDKSFTPFQNFKSNILKSKILIYTAQEIKDVWPKIHNHLSDFNINDKSTNWKTFLDELFSYAQTGLTSYYVYTEQALVTAITAMESYFINKLAYLIQNDPRLINRFLEKNIKLKRLVDYKLNISDNIG